MSHKPTTEEVLAAVGVARQRHAEQTGPTRVLDALGREWLTKRNGSWAALGHSLHADSLAEIQATYGPTEVLG